MAKLIEASHENTYHLDTFELETVGMPSLLIIPCKVDDFDQRPRCCSSPFIVSPSPLSPFSKQFKAQVIFRSCKKSSVKGDGNVLQSSEGDYPTAFTNLPTPVPASCLLHTSAINKQ